MKIYIENNEAIPAVKIQDDVTAAPIGYTEVIDIVGVEKYGLQGVHCLTAGWRDRKNVRDKLKALIYTKMGIAVPADAESDVKYALLTAAEKSIALNWFILGKEAWQFALVNDDKHWAIKASEYRKWTMDMRIERLRRMESIVFRRLLNIADAKQILADISQISKDTILDIDTTTKKLIGKVQTKQLSKMYIDGLESLEDDGVSALKDYINSTAGTPFATDGFRNLTYTFRMGNTANSVADELLLIVDGTW